MFDGKKKFHQSFFLSHMRFSPSNGLALIRDEYRANKRALNIYTSIQLFSLENLWAILSFFCFQLCYLPFHAYFSLFLCCACGCVWKTFYQQHIYTYTNLILGIGWRPVVNDNKHNNHQFKAPPSNHEHVKWKARGRTKPVNSNDIINGNIHYMYVCVCPGSSL